MSANYLGAKLSEAVPDDSRNVSGLTLGEAAISNGSIIHSVESRVEEGL